MSHDINVTFRTTYARSEIFLGGFKLETFHSGSILSGAHSLVTSLILSAFIHCPYLKWRTQVGRSCTESWSKSVRKYCDTVWFDAFLFLLCLSIKDSNYCLLFLNLWRKYFFIVNVVHINLAVKQEQCFSLWKENNEQYLFLLIKYEMKTGRQFGKVTNIYTKILHYMWYWKLNKNVNSSWNM